MLIKRQIEKRILRSSKKYPVISITGPRQSGKTTLAKMIFPDYAYVSLERPDYRQQAIEDPNRFIRSYPAGVILDEVQHVPELFSYIQYAVDEKKQPGRFILTGSQNFLLIEKINQSLAGRVAIFSLLPFSLHELKKTDYEYEEIDRYLFTGMYPPIYDIGYEPKDWCLNYIRTYLERDIRNIRNITNLALFQKFLALCAGRVGQLLNTNSLAGECGISHNTARDWLSVLEASYVIFRLAPYYVNFNKRIVKQPKLYFYDTGLVCALLGISGAEQIATHYLRGNIFETYIISEIIKQQYALGGRTGWFWRDRHGHEVDYLLNLGGRIIPVEIKSGETLTSDFFKGLKYWNRLADNAPEDSILIYGGREQQQRKHARVFGWNQIDEIYSRSSLP